MDDLNKYKIVRMKRAINALLEQIQNKSFPVERIILFGSVLTQKFNEYSDLDLCIVVDRELSSRDLRMFEQEMQESLDGEIEANFIYCTSSKLEKGEYVFQDIKEKGVTVWQAI